MKVVKISANFLPRRCGIGDYARRLCENLVNFRKDIYIYIITSADPKIIEYGYSYERIEILPTIKSWSFEGLVQIRKIIKEISPDIVHIEYNMDLYGRAIAMNFLPYLLKKDGLTPKIMITFHELPNPLRSGDPFFWLMSLSILIYCDRIIVTNNVDFNSLICKLPFIKRKCALVPVGSNIPKVESERSMVRKELNIPDDALILSFFGFIREDKCLAELFYAFLELLQTKPNLKLLIIGGVYNKKIFLSLQKLSHKLNINDMIIWTYYQPGERVSELLSASDIVILPYKNGIGTNSGAFAACVLHNLPIITTRAKFMPEVIKDNYNLMLVEPGSLKELTDVLFRITQDQNLRKKLSVNLKELNHYLSWQRISQEISKLYTENNIIKSAKSPLAVLKRRISSFLAPYKYRAPDGYNAEKYWKDRLSKYGFNLRGVGDINLSPNENEQIYLKAKKVFLSLCRDEGVDFENLRMLDIGCGNGFYARIFLENGGKQYLGIDITDILFSRLKQDFPEFQFRKLDISTQELDGQFDLIIMIDVTQHIVNDDKFSFAMQNIRTHLSRDGVFIVTSWLSDRVRHSFYETSRAIDAYKREFPGYVFSEPIPFKDKFIFSIRRSKRSQG